MIEGVVLRRAVQEDTPFVADSWLRSMRGAPRYRRLRWHTYREHARPWVSDRLRYSEVYVAVLADDPDYILGWVAVEQGDPPTVWYAYVRQTYRGAGLGRVLLAVAPVALAGWRGRRPQGWEVSSDAV